MVGPTLGVCGIAQFDDGVEGHVGAPRCVRQGSLLQDLETTVIADAADIAAARRHDVVEQLELGITASMTYR